VGWAVRHSSLARSISVHADDLLGYGKPHPEEKWWFDLEDVDGTFRIPPPVKTESNILGNLGRESWD
jgi:hypothetical protein